MKNAVQLPFAAQVVSDFYLVKPSDLADKKQDKTLNEAKMMLMALLSANEDIRGSVLASIFGYESFQELEALGEAAIIAADKIEGFKDKYDTFKRVIYGGQ